MKKIICIALVAFVASNSTAQNIGIGTTSPDASAMLDINATNKGLLIPQVNLSGTNDITTIPSAANSLLIYNRATAGIGTAAVTPGYYYWDSFSSTWIRFIAANNNPAAWLLSGNNNTSVATNFIGTADNQSLVFKINNSNAGYLGTTGNTYWGLKSGNINNAGYSNVAVGNAALNQNANRSNQVAVGDSTLLNNGTGATLVTEAINNTAIGSKALYLNNTGSYNTALGFNALWHNTSGTYNTATGDNALRANSTGTQNTANGRGAMFFNTSGSFNTANGVASLGFNTTGNGNTANGNNALFGNTTGYSNVAVGTNALKLNTNKSNMVAIGDSALYNNVIGYQNTAVGSKALYTNADGIGNTASGFQSLYSNASGNYNTASGYMSLYSNAGGSDNIANGITALYYNSTGSFNAATGYSSLFYNTTGSGNTAYGMQTLTGNTTGHNNIAIGFSASYNNADANENIAIGTASLYNNTGDSNTAVGDYTLITNATGINNTALGYRADVGFANISNATAIGANAKADNANSMVFGNGAITGWAFGRTAVTSGNALQVGTGATNGNGARLTVGGAWTNASDSSKKDNITKLDGISILAKLKQLPITRWKYKGTNEYHIGPMAQDFYTLFNVGTDDKSISSLDPAGIALKAIQEQQQQIDVLNKLVLKDNHIDIDFVFNGVSKGYINHLTGKLVDVSDLRMKKDIRSLGEVLPGIMQLQGKTFHYKDNNSDEAFSYGFIAQEVEKIFPDFVTNKGTDSMKAVTCQNFSVLAIKGMQEQQLVIEAQQKQIDLLVAQNKMIMKEIEKLMKK